MLRQIRKATKKPDVAKNMWKRIPHLMQQYEIPRKGHKIKKLEHFTIKPTSCYNKSLLENSPKKIRALIG